MEKKLDISVISPVFNELENLETFVESVTVVMNSTNMSWELIIVDDGSDDGSSKIIKKIYEAYFFQKITVRPLQFKQVLIMQLVNIL